MVTICSDNGGVTPLFAFSLGLSWRNISLAAAHAASCRTLSSSPTATPCGTSSCPGAFAPAWAIPGASRVGSSIGSSVNY